MVDMVIPNVLQTARISKIHLNFVYTAPDEVVTGDYLAPVTHSVLREFWNEKLAYVAPAIAKVGCVKRLAYTASPIEQIAKALQRFTIRNNAQKAHIARAAARNATAATRTGVGSGLDLEQVGEDGGPFSFAAADTAGAGSPSSVAGPSSAAEQENWRVVDNGDSWMLITGNPRFKNEDLWWSKEQESAIPEKDEISAGLTAGLWSMAVARDSRAGRPVRSALPVVMENHAKVGTMLIEYDENFRGPESPRHERPVEGSPEVLPRSAQKRPWGVAVSLARAVSLPLPASDLEPTFVEGGNPAADAGYPRAGKRGRRHLSEGNAEVERLPPAGLPATGGGAATSCDTAG